MTHQLAVSLTVLLAVSFVSSTVIDAPRINLPSQGDSFVADVHSSVRFKCSGSRPVQWRAQHQNNFAQNTFKFTAQFELHNVTVSDVGYYTCAYVNCTSSSPTCSSSIYLYVKDEDNLLTLQNQVYFLKVPSDQDFVVPCKPSFPQVEVSLTQASGTEVTWKYSPQDGFAANKTLLTHTGIKICEGIYKGIRTSYFIQDVNEPITPWVQVTGAWQMRHANMSFYDVLEGTSVALHCNKIERTDGEPYWLYDVAHTHQEERFAIETNKIESSSILTITNARVDDSGTYHCYVGNRYYNSSTVPVFIQVFKNDTASVSFPNNSYDIHLDEMNDIIHWVILYEGHPSIPSIKWTHNGVVLASTAAGAVHVVNDRYHINVSREDGTVILRITNPYMGDVGSHQLEACIKAVNEVCKNISFSLTVLGGPEEVKSYVQGGVKVAAVNSEVEVSCSALGNPRPTLSLLYAYCSSPSNCSAYQHIATELQINSCSGEEVSESCNGLPATAAKTSYKVPINTSGMFVCEANNTHGSVSSAEYFVAAIESKQAKNLEALSLNYSLDGTSTGNCNHQADGCTVYTPATVSLTCQANIFHFWDKKPVIFAGHLEDCAAEKDCSGLTELGVDGATVVRFIEWSTALTHFVNVSLALDTNSEKCLCYECVLPSERGSTNEKVGLRMRIREKSEPWFVSNLKPEYEIKVQDELHLSCALQGQPLPRVFWYKDEGKLAYDSDHIEISEDGQQLTLKFLRVDDSGSYKCQTDSNFGFKNISQSTKVVVVDPNARQKEILLYAVIGFSVVLGIILLVSAVLLLRFHKKRKSQEEQDFAQFIDGNEDRLTRDIGLSEQALLLPMKKEFQFPRNKLEYEKLLGSGAFGMVYRAKVRGPIRGEVHPYVAVKEVKSRSDENQLKCLVSEVKIMMHLGRHTNVVNLLGVCTENYRLGQFQIIVEYCKYGNLLNFLREKKAAFINAMNRDGTLRNRKSRLSSNCVYMNMPNPGNPTQTYTRSRSQSAVSTLRREPVTPPAGTANSKFPSLPNSPTYNPQEANYDKPCPQMSKLDASNTIPRCRAKSSSDANSSMDTISGSSTLVNTVNGSSSMLNTVNGSSSMVNAVNGSLGSGGVEYANLMSDMTQTVSDGATDPVEEPVIFDINNYTLLGWCYQIACGMDYLAKHNVLHGDLAARNILLAENNIVKISDFGLSKSLYNYQYKANFKKPMPIKWMAIESLRDGIFSTQSDVWAYGVVMWEVFSLGQVPYPTIDLNKNFVNQLESGVRLHKPQYASEKLFEVMRLCWLENPAERPKFDALQELLQAFMDDKTRKYYEDMNVADNEPVENSLLSRVRSPDIRAMSIDADGYEVPKQHPDSGLYENGMLHRNINSLSLTIPPSDELGDEVPMQLMNETPCTSPHSPRTFPQSPCTFPQSPCTSPQSRACRSVTPLRAIKSPRRLRSVSISASPATIYEETVFNFPPTSDQLEPEVDFVRPGHDSGIFNSPTPFVDNPGYYTLGSNELQSEKTPVLYKQASRLEKRESETSSGIGSLHGPSFDSVSSLSPTSPECRPLLQAV